MNGTDLGFPAYLAALLRERGLTAARVARQAGISPTVLGNWIHGARPRPDTLRKVAPALEVHPDELMRAAGYLGPTDGGASIGAVDLELARMDRELTELLVRWRARLRRLRGTE